MANLADKSGDAYSNIVRGNGTATATFVMPGTVPLEVSSVVATVDNSAGGDTRATIVIRDQAGEVIATKRQGEAIPAGDTGTATWALRLDDNGVGIRYGFVNSGDWLYIGAAGSNTLTDGYGIKFAAPDGFEFVAQGGGGNFVATLSNEFFVTANDIDFTGTGSQVTDFSGQSVGNHNSATYAGDFTLQAATGITLETTNTALDFLTHGGNVTINPQGGAIAIGQSVSDFVGFFGVPPAQQQPIPVTLGDVIALLQAYGLAG